MAQMTVYHGGYEATEKPEIRANKNTKDFGTGFYCTIIKRTGTKMGKTLQYKNCINIRCEDFL